MTEHDGLKRSKTELLPCPFCGGAARMFHYYSGKARVCCIGCGANTDRPFETMQEAADAWNTRAQQTCHYEFISNIVIGSISLDACGLRCSSCGREQMGLEPPNYCPDCGKKVV